MEHLAAADPQGQWHGQTKEELGEGNSSRPVVDGLGQFLEEISSSRPEFGDFGRFPSKGLHYPDSGDVLLDDRAHGSVPLMDAPPSGLQLGGKPGHAGHGGNEGQQGHQAEPWAGDENEGQGSD